MASQRNVGNGHGKAGPLRVHLIDEMESATMHWNPMANAWLPELHAHPLCGRSTVQESVLMEEIGERLWRWQWGFPTCLRCARVLAEATGALT